VTVCPDAPILHLIIVLYPSPPEAPYRRNHSKPYFFKGTVVQSPPNTHDQPDTVGFRFASMVAFCIRVLLRVHGCDLQPWRHFAPTAAFCNQGRILQPSPLMGLTPLMGLMGPSHPSSLSAYPRGRGAQSLDCYSFSRLTELIREHSGQCRSAAADGQGH